MEYKVLNEFIYRIPLLSINKFYSLLKGLEKSYSPLNDKIIQEAIYLASPLLYDEIIKLIDGKITNTKDVERIKYSTIRYLARMSSRCTPFGLFASCNIGKLSKSTNLIVDSDIERFVRLDMTYLNTLYDSLLSEEEIRYKIPLYPNSSLYKVFNKYRYIEYKYVNNIKKYQISQIDSDQNVSRILNLSKNGIAAETLINILCHEGYTNHDSKSYINDLINSKILVYELSQSVTGSDYLTRIIALLQKVNADITTIAKLKNIKKSLSIENNNISFIDRYKFIENNVRKLGVNFDKKYLLQVDSIRKNSQITIDEKIIKELKSTIALLDKLTPYDQNESIELFKSNFIRKYESKEVSLTEALDPEFGLGYPININKMDCSPLVDDLILPNNKDSYIGTKNTIQELIINKIIGASNNPSIDEIIIDDSDIQNFNNNIDNLPSTLACFFEIISIKPNILISLKSIGGASAANLISRFAYTGTEVNTLVKKITDIEQKYDNDSILAEICYLPENRTGNILFRPHIRDFEILYLSTSDIDIQNQIPVSDLMLSVKNNNFYLRSKRLNKRIIPRLSNAHNFRRNPLPIYNFLCDMQNIGVRQRLFFSLGEFNNILTYRPRIKYKNTILLKAKWSISSEYFLNLYSYDDDILLVKITDLRNKYKLPLYIKYIEGDNELFIDLSIPINIRSFLAIVKPKRLLNFEEVLPTIDKLPFNNIYGNYFNESIVIFTKYEKHEN